MRTNGSQQYKCGGCLPVTGQTFYIGRSNKGVVTNTDCAQQGRVAPVVVALGGNALHSKQGSPVKRTAEQLAGAVETGHSLVLTHGNGPQVGNLLLQQESTGETQQLPLDVLVAQTQAQLGYPLQTALDDRLPGDSRAVTVVTRTLVDPDDPAFEEPTKPVGPFYTEAEAGRRAFETRRVADDEQPYRRVVSSPEPRDILEHEEIAGLSAEGTVPICAGGGGIPVVRDNGIRGVEAVVDKDRTSQLLASKLGADIFVVLTDVDCAYLDYGHPDQRPLGAVSAGELRQHLEAGEFAVGSMQPKVESCLRFVENGGRRAVISSIEHLSGALDGAVGTQVRS